MRAATTARARARTDLHGEGSRRRRDGRARKTARRSASERESVDVRDIKRRLRAACARAQRASVDEGRERGRARARARAGVGERGRNGGRVQGEWSVEFTRDNGDERRRESGAGERGRDRRRVDGREWERWTNRRRGGGGTRALDRDAESFPRHRPRPASGEQGGKFELFGRPLSVTLDAECGFNDSVTHPTRLNVRFRAVEVKSRLGRRQIIRLDFASPEGWIETTYVDDDLRTGRGDKGSIFIAARVIQTTTR